MKLMDEKYSNLIHQSLYKCGLVDNLKTKTILVSGSTGLIGSAMISFFLYFNKLYSNSSINIIALTNSKVKAQNIFKDNVTILDWDSEWEKKYLKIADYFIHCSSITNSKMFVKKPVDTIDSIIKDSRRVLEFITQSTKCKMVYLSSMEIYGIKNFFNFPIDEHGYGYLDNLSVRSSYSQAKALVETLCIAFMNQYNCKVNIARLCQILSTNFEDCDERMFAQFIRSAKQEKKIVLQTLGNTRRTYCSLPDCISALLFILIKGENGNAYNVANKNMNYSVKEIADIICKKYNGIVEINENFTKENGYLPTINMQLDSSSLQDLGWNCQIKLEDILNNI